MTSAHCDNMCLAVAQSTTVLLCSVFFFFIVHSVSVIENILYSKFSKAFILSFQSLPIITGHFFWRSEPDFAMLDAKQLGFYCCA